jgi:hypothetical protein
MIDKIKNIFRSRDAQRLAKVVADMRSLEVQRRVRYIEIERYDENDPAYINSLATMAASGPMRFFLNEMREALIEQFEKTPSSDETALLSIGAEIKAVGKIRAYLEKAIGTAAALKAGKK